MKRYITIVLILLISVSSYSATYTAYQDGDWNDVNTWGSPPPATTPQDGDIVIIPSGITVSITTHVGSFFNQLDINITISGILSLIYSGGGDGPGLFRANAVGMWLPATSTVTITSGGQLNSTSNNTVQDYNFFSIGIDGTYEYDVSVDGSPVDGPDAIDSEGVLPIELISFNANLAGEVVDITWATASEINNEFYTLERSVDGVNWEIIGEEDGAGNSSERLDYSFVDYNPVPGLSYYRLKQTDYDGQFEYFAPAVVSYEPGNLFKVFPNPTVDVIQLTTSSDLKNAEIFIKNLNGQIKISKVATTPHQLTLDLTSLPTGVYLLEIVFPESVLSQRIVKK